MLELRRAEESACTRIHEIQVESFAELLIKYQDYESNPAAEGVERIRQRFAQPFTEYYLIYLDASEIGMLRVCNFGEVCRLSPICILPQYQGRGGRLSSQVQQLLETNSKGER